MKRYLLISTALVVVGIQPVALRADDAAPATASPTAVLFQSKCSFCHGDGHGNAQRAAFFQLPPEKLDLSKSKATSVELEQVLRKGRKKMPAYNTLTDAQIKDLVAYVQTLSATKAQKNSQ